MTGMQVLRIMVSSVIFVVCLAVHLSTFTGIDPQQRWPNVMLLHIVVLIWFFIIMFNTRTQQGASPVSSQASRQKLDFLSTFPKWARAAIIFLFIYTAFNFAAFFFQTYPGGPGIFDGRKAMTSHGHLIRYVTDSEYSHMESLEVRGFSGHWLLFSGIALATCSWTRRPATPGHETL